MRATPKEPNAFPFVASVARRKSGETAAVPPRTMVASSAPGSSLRRPILRWSRKWGRSQPEHERAEDPDGDEHEPAAGVAELGLCDEDERDRCGEDEEEDRVEHLIGRRCDADVPGARIYVLVELADPDSPEQEGDDHREASRERVRGRAPEGVAHQIRRAAGQIQMVDQVLREHVHVPGGVHGGDEHERGRQHREARVDRDGAARVAAGGEVGTEPLEPEPAERPVRSRTQPPHEPLDAAVLIRLACRAADRVVRRHPSTLRRLDSRRSKRRPGTLSHIYR